MTNWPNVPLGELMKQDTKATPVHADQEYPNFGIYSFGRGLFVKPPISGATTSAKCLYQVREGQFIYSRLFAFEGAYGLVEEKFDGCFISNEYPHFDCDPKRLSPAGDPRDLLRMAESLGAGCNALDWNGRQTAKNPARATPENDHFASLAP